VLDPSWERKPRIRRGGRYFFGQARQEDLLRYLSDRIPEESLQEILERLQVDLSPPRAK